MTSRQRRDEVADLLYHLGHEWSTVYRYLRKTSDPWEDEPIIDIETRYLAWLSDSANWIDHNSINLA